MHDKSEMNTPTPSSAIPQAMIPLSAIRPIAVEAIREVMGCSDVVGKDGSSLIEALEEVAQAAADVLAIPQAEDPAGLPALPEPYTVASTIKCTACGKPWVPRTAAVAAFGAIAPSACECGNRQFGGTVSSENVSPAQFTASQMLAFRSEGIRISLASKALAAVTAEGPKKKAISMPSKEWCLNAGRAEIESGVDAIGAGAPAAASAVELPELPVVGYFNFHGNALAKGVPRFSTDIPLVRLSDARTAISAAMAARQTARHPLAEWVNQEQGFQALVPTSKIPEQTLLYAMAAREAVPAWLPMESAPKDGTAILLGYISGHSSIASHSEEGYWMGDADRNHWGRTGWFATGDDVLCDDPSQPDCWMPLPAAPSPSAKLEDGGQHE